MSFPLLILYFSFGPCVRPGTADRCCTASHKKHFEQATWNIYNLCCQKLSFFARMLTSKTALLYTPYISRRTVFLTAAPVRAPHTPATCNTTQQNFFLQSSDLQTPHCRPQRGVLSTSTQELSSCNAHWLAKLSSPSSTTSFSALKTTCLYQCGITFRTARSTRTAYKESAKYAIASFASRPARVTPPSQSLFSKPKPPSLFP